MQHQQDSIDQSDDRLIFHSSLSLIDTPDGVKKAITSDYDAMKLVCKVGRFVKDLAELKIPTPLFNVTLNFRGSPVLSKGKDGAAFIRMLKLGIATMPDHFPDQIFSPRFVLLSKAVKRYCLESFSDADLVASIDVVTGICNRLNSCIKMIQDEAQSAKFKTRLIGHTKASMKNYRGSCRFINHLLLKHKRGIRVIRLDLSYKRKTALCEFDTKISNEEVFRHRAELIDALPELVHCNALVGYIWKTEYKIAKNFHNHLLIFIDANKLRQDVSIAAAIGEHWKKSITDNRGHYENVNAEYLGRMDEVDTYVGLIRSNDTQKIDALKRIGVGYLCKPDYLYRWKVPTTNRAFGRTEIKKTPNRVKRSKLPQLQMINTGSEDSKVDHHE
jgi:hypothetical protein